MMTSAWTFLEQELAQTSNIKEGIRTTNRTFTEQAACFRHPWLSKIRLPHHQAAALEDNRKSKTSSNFTKITTTGEEDKE